MKIGLAVFAALMVAACGGVPVTRDDAGRAQFAAKPSEEEAMQKIRAYLERVLIDPESLRLKCSKVTDRAWARQNMFDRPQFGYLVVCDVNAKNKFGGYTGGKEHIFLFNGSAFQVFDDSLHGSSGGRGTHYDLIN